MKAATYYRYGPPQVLSVEQIPEPELKAEEILIKIHNSTVNSADWRLRKADPFLVRLFFGLVKPKKHILGTTFSGVVTEKGKNVTNFDIGDAVFGLSDENLGTHAEYLAINAKGPIAIKPKQVGHSDAAAIVFGGHTALHFLRQVKNLKNKHILVYGASGAVGTMAVQLAKHFGAQVTGVCSGTNVELVRSLGADDVIDYTQTDIYTVPGRFDVIYETVNKTEVLKLHKLLNPKGTLILGSALVKGMIQGSLVALFTNKKVVSGVAKTSSEDMRYLIDLLANGQLRAVVDRAYSLDEIIEAHTYVEKGHKKGNVVLQIAE